MLRKDGYLQPAILQVVGILLLVGAFVLYYLTGQESGLLIAAAIALIGVGSGIGAIVTVRQELREAAKDAERSPPVSEEPYARRPDADVDKD